MMNWKKQFCKHDWLCVARKNILAANGSYLYTCYIMVCAKCRTIKQVKDEDLFKMNYTNAETIIFVSSDTELKDNWQSVVCMKSGAGELVEASKRRITIYDVHLIKNDSLSPNKKRYRWDRSFASSPVILSNGEEILHKPYYIKQINVKTIEQHIAVQLHNYLCTKGLALKEEGPDETIWLDDAPSRDSCQDFYHDYLVTEKEVNLLRLSQKMIKLFPDNQMDHDPFIFQARNSLLNAIVFFLCFKREPDKPDFISVRNMLLNEKNQLELCNFHSHLDYMYTDTKEKQPIHTGHLEYTLYKKAGRFGQLTAVNNLLEHFNILLSCIDNSMQEKNI